MWTKITRTPQKSTKSAGKFAGTIDRIYRPVSCFSRTACSESVLVGEAFAVLLEHPGVFFIPDIADPLEEQQRQDVALPVSAIDGGATKDVGGFPEG